MGEILSISFTYKALEREEGRHEQSGFQPRDTMRGLVGRTWIGAVGRCRARRTTDRWSRVRYRQGHIEGQGHLREVRPRQAKGRGGLVCACASQQGGICVVECRCSDCTRGATSNVDKSTAASLSRSASCCCALRKASSVITINEMYTLP